MLTVNVRRRMSDFWVEHSTQADLTEMMLDSKADEISEVERDEILAAVPDFKGKDVLELGAGIGYVIFRRTNFLKIVAAVTSNVSL